MGTNYIYCVKTTSNLDVCQVYPEIVNELQKIIDREGYSGVGIFSEDIKVIDGDDLERNIAVSESRNLRMSMDSAFCLVSQNGEKIVLVEYKFNQNDPNKFFKEDLEGKVNGTKEALGLHKVYHFHYYFVVNENIYNQTVRRFFRIDPKLDSNYTPVTITAIKDLFFK